MMEIFKKIIEARQYVKTLDVKKAGHNDYSNYDYYTPEQIGAIMGEIEKKFNLFMHFDLVRDDFGKEIGILKVIDIESEGHATWKMATDVAELKATNKAQQYGGTMTYCKRYLQMNAFDIADNSADFDSIEKAKKKADAKKLVVGSATYNKAVKVVASGGSSLDDVCNYYTVSADVKKSLEDDIKKAKAGSKGASK